MSQLDKPTRSALAQGELDRLRSERDEALRIAAELRGLLREMRSHMHLTKITPDPRQSVCDRIDAALKDAP